MPPIVALSVVQSTNCTQTLVPLQTPHSPRYGTAACGAEPIVVGGKAGPTERRLHAELVRRGVRGARFSRVCPDYYSFPLEKRMSLLCAPSVFHLCVPTHHVPACVCEWNYVSTRTHPLTRLARHPSCVIERVTHACGLLALVQTVAPRHTVLLRGGMCSAFVHHVETCSGK
jgi:hypothetical protein